MQNKFIKFLVQVVALILVAIVSITAYHYFVIATPMSPNGAYQWGQPEQIKSLSVNSDQSTFVFSEEGNSDKGTVSSLNEGNYLLKGKKNEYLLQIRQGRSYCFAQLTPKMSKVSKINKVNDVPMK
ncbi:MULTISPECIES: hypothetical protein [unclassified Lactococcus]|uniref:hypothetical protein n=1 Tax=unclassified Lactococcus TaxID=2643510 RepID=UPI0011CCDAB1|nr:MULTISPECIES: hypothetical protein [unclassified Lactococcus]MQW22862.1 hypothetical protein [Lactococcus sp. dk101]TXK44590.1 hypothetical protein FVP42_04880 [Lactococcus sp. dk310]TXK50443.1 hypothetical protein FVP43_04850 [Lactococcus sp. dk322]